MYISEAQKVYSVLLWKNYEAGIVRSSFLIFEPFEPRYSYKNMFRRVRGRTSIRSKKEREFSTWTHKVPCVGRSSCCCLWKLILWLRNQFISCADNYGPQDKIPQLRPPMANSLKFPRLVLFGNLIRDCVLEMFLMPTITCPLYQYPPARSPRPRTPRPRPPQQDPPRPRCLSGLLQHQVALLVLLKSIIGMKN